MQYLLSKEEFDLLKEQANGHRINATNALQAFCTRVADELPVSGWHAEGDAKRPWGCILTKEHKWVCDECPSKDVCPYEHKEWSK